MLKTLLKKQLLELTRNFFYNAKKNKARPKKQIIGMAVLYFVLFYVFLGILGTCCGNGLRCCLL